MQLQDCADARDIKDLVGKAICLSDDVKNLASETCAAFDDVTAGLNGNTILQVGTSSDGYCQILSFWLSQK